MRKLYAVVVAAAVVAGAAGCTSSPSQGDDATFAEGGTFTLAVAGDPGSLNPMNNSSTTSNWLFRFLYDTLVTRSDDGSIASGLATDWTFDGTTAVFTLNPDATCSDGSKLTPSVVAKNFDYVKNPDNPQTIVGSVLQNRDFTTQADDANNTFTLTLGTPFSLLMSSLSFMPIVCGDAATDPSTLTTTSSGSGPFVLTSASPNNEYVMTKNPDYTWGPDGASTSEPGTPDKVVFKIVDNESTSANLLLSGDVNAAVVNGQDRARLEAVGADQKTYTSGGVVMSFNEGDGRITADENVRLALTMALDRGAVAKTVTQGLLPDAGTSISAANPQVCDDSSVAGDIPAMDVDKANSLLDAAGWTKGADGIRTKDGQKLSLVTGYSTATPGAAAAVELIADAWSKIGVEAVITPMTQSDYSTRVFSTGDYDVMPVEQFSNPFPSTLTGLVGGPFPPDGTNAGHIDNADYKAAVAQALVSSEDSGCADWNKAASALYTSADMIPMASWPTNWVVKGAQMDALGGRPISTSVRLLAN